MKRISCRTVWLLALALGMTATTTVFSQTQTVTAITPGDDQSLNKTLAETPDKTEVHKNIQDLTTANKPKHEAVFQRKQNQFIPKDSTEAREPFHPGGTVKVVSNDSTSVPMALPIPPQHAKPQLDSTSSAAAIARGQLTNTPAATQKAPVPHDSAVLPLFSQKLRAMGTHVSLDFFINPYVLAIIISMILYTGAAYSGALLMHIFIWKGHFEQAARIAERRLKRRPHDAKLCATLANIYLALNRHDERANEIYRKALRFDPATDNRSKITSLIVQYCKHEEEMDSEVWKVCGGALSA